MRLSGWTLIFPSQKSHSDRLLGKTGEADRAIEYSASQTDLDENLDYYYEEHHKEWDTRHP